MYVRIILSLFLSLLLQLNIGHLYAATIHTYAGSSVLSQGKWAKIKVTQSGVHKLTYDEIRNMGFSDPSNIRVFGYGGAMLNEDFRQSRIDDLPEIAIYDGGSFILFYAQGPVKWDYNASSSGCKFNFTINPYADYGCYFLTTDAGSKKRITQESAETTDGYVWEATKFVDYAYVKKEEKNYVRSGRVWYGDILLKGQSKRYTFNFPNIDMEREATIRISAVGTSTQTTYLNITCDNVSGRIEYNGVSGYKEAYAGEEIIKKYPTSATIPVLLQYAGAASTDKSALDFITVNAWRNLIMSGNAMPFRNYETIGSQNYTRFTLQNASQSIKIWNATDPSNLTEVPATLTGNKLEFIKKTEQLLEFVAVNPAGQFPSPEFVEIVNNQNLHAFPASTDFVIISHPDFLSEAERLAQKHAEFDQMVVKVVTPEQVYNEFSSGTPDATAYRWLMKMIYDRNEGLKSHYLLLFGDGSYDNKAILATQYNPAKNYILTFQSTESLVHDESFGTDDYFGFLQDAEGQPNKYGFATVDIGIGRFPVSDITEAKAAVDKAIEYMENKNKGVWKNRVCLVADDNEKQSAYSTFNRFVGYSEKISNIIYTNNPIAEIKKIYMDAYPRVSTSSGGRFPEAETVFYKEIDAGISFLNYIGHSGHSAWSEEKIFTQSQARSLSNKNWGFWFTASCEFARFDDYTSSGGRDLFLNPKGGAIALYSASRVVYDDRNDKLNQTLANVIFERDEEGRPLRFGDIYKKSKRPLIESSINKLSFVLFADPALRFSYPDLYVKTDSVTFLSGEKTDTINALSIVKVYGKIEDDANSFISNFTGKVNMKVYDKEQTLYTRGQKYYVSNGTVRDYKYPYKDRPNILFSGEAEVVNGQFSFIFRLPKDINYSYGSGRMSYYAYDDKNGFEAAGVYEDVIVGGSDDSAEYEYQGPEVTMYLNTESFKSGDKVNESPVFYAFVSDESGINTSGAGIGHDMTLTLNDSKDPIVLNSSFMYALGSYTQGSVFYQFNDLEEGTYTLTFRVWDLLNNSTTKQIEFEVVKNLPIKIESIVAGPNPATEYVHFHILHDRPNAVIDYKLTISDLNGMPVWESYDEDYRVDSEKVSLEWDLRRRDGVRVKDGVYIYRVEMRTADSEYIGKSQKLIILPQ